MTPETNVLTRIVDGRRRHVADAQRRVPGHTLRARLGFARPAGRLERALRRRGKDEPIRLLCEIKRASPSGGMLRADLDPVAMAKLYEGAGAAAISLVTEPDFFQGDLGWVDAVRPAVSVPLLLKDFVVDSYQLLDATARGADAVLLIAAVLSEVQTQRLIGEARLLGLDCLVEVHDEGELVRSVRAGATVIGINNRDLRTLDVDLETSSRLLPLVPPLVTAVVESGLAGPESVARLRSTRCDAVLVGTAFMSSQDPAATVKGFVAAGR